MTAALAHRGPDDEGFYADEDVALGFRRLAVIDLATGAQPIRLEDDRAVIVLNGEIYNYRELRAPLARRQTFRSEGDVEVVLRLYAEEGIDALRRLNGMFALALWDRARRTLYLARDRHGIKPLFIARAGREVAFASEVRGLLAGGYPRDRAIDPLELRHYLWQKHLSPSGSFFAGIRSLEPGTVLEIGPRGERTWRYWDPPAPHTLSPGAPSLSASPALDAALARTEELVTAAVRRQLVADVPLGVFLSGGVDSGTLAALAAREAGKITTFTVGFEGPGAASELPAARATARALGSDHHELTMDERRIAEELPRIAAHLDGPQGDATVIPTWFMCAHARTVVTVALSGEGADELFGGYARQRYDVWIDRLGAPGRAALPLALRLAGRPVSARLQRRLALPPSPWRQLDWSRVFTADAIDALVQASLPGGVALAGEDALTAQHAAFAARWHARAASDPLGARLETDRELFLPGDLLPKVDRMSMAHSLEVRVPYLDDELVDFVVPLPGALKIAGRRDKRLLRDLAERVMPVAAQRRKQGFTAPLAAWLRGPLRAAVTDYLEPGAVRRRGLFRADEVARLVDEHLSARADHAEPVFLLLALEAWLREAVDRLPSAAGAAAVRG